MSDVITTEQWMQSAGLSLRLILVDPDATLSDESRASIQAIVDNSPAGLYDNVDAELQPILNIITVIEALNGLIKK